MVTGTTARVTESETGTGTAAVLLGAAEAVISDSGGVEAVLRIVGRASVAGIELGPGLIVTVVGSAPAAVAAATSSVLVLVSVEVLTELLSSTAAAVAAITSVVVLASVVVAALPSPSPSNWEFAIGASTVVG